MFKHVLTAGVLIWGASMAGLQSDRSNSKSNPLASDPDHVKVAIADLPSRAKAPETVPTKTFKVGKKVRFAITTTNTSDSAVTVYAIDSFYQNRPQLFKGGQLIPYREEVVQLLEWKDKDPIGERMPTALIIEPGQTKTFWTLDLNDWYGSLDPGVYQLSNRNRLVYGGKWTTNSPTITFAISTTEN